MKIPGVGPNVELALEHFTVLTVLHNAVPIFLAIGMITTLAWALYRPSRGRILVFVGLAVLLLHYEFVKHIMPALHAQTQLTLTTEVPDYRFIWVTNKIITRIVPFVMLVSGWGSLVLGTWLCIRSERLQKKLKTV